ncbi:MAG: NAD-dependent epimerase/dehydratase family protein [Candidatus Omnitrophota bacterium]|jgi:dTDP-L-rhamnose 4-epimerase
MKVLVTGGCGFIGSHLVDKLVQDGHDVKAYDVLEPQVHGNRKPEYLNKGAQYIYADIRNKEELKKALKGIEVIFHEASQVGVGQSMYKIEKYVSHNSYGTAVLLDLIVNTKNKIKKIVVASSMSIYGEGAYKCKLCGVVYPQLREEKQLKESDWGMKCPHCARPVIDVPTFETKPLFPTSIYATSKRCQEEMCLEVGISYKIPTVALRYFNVYGPRQSLNNPYTGVCAIFLSRVKNNRQPLIFEDGLQSRDFIYVNDIVDANILAMKKKQADYSLFNVGSGKPHSILEIAQKVAKLYNKNIRPCVLNKYRAGDIRHCYADIKKINSRLGFVPKIGFEKGMKMLFEWSQNQKAVDSTSKAQDELRKKGLAR